MKEMVEDEGGRSGRGAWEREGESEVSANNAHMQARGEEWARQDREEVIRQREEQMACIGHSGL